MSYSSPLTLEIVKNELGISPGDTTYDAQITERLPFAEAKFRQVANYDFNSVVTMFYDSGSDEIRVWKGPNSNVDYLRYGDIILSADHPDGTYVIQNYRIPQYNYQSDEGGIYYDLKVSNNATDDSDGYGSDVVVCYNISNYAVLSQIVWFMIGEQDTSKVGEAGLRAKSVGPLSVTYSDGDMNQRFGLPNKIVQQIPKYESWH